VSFLPELFGKFVLLEKLAAGGMAEVYLAKIQGAENVSKFVAVKRILPQFSNNSEFIDMFKAEAKIAVNLAHPNIVSIFEFGVEKGQFYLAMEYVEGRNLRQILNRMKELGRSFPQDQAIYLINDAARGLDHAHRCIDGTTGNPLNIIHRDISPQNIMISFEGSVKIVDFGIAKAESQVESTRAGTLKGKFSYMSPEQAEGQEIDSRTDVFSLGIILWEILASDRLFLSNNEMNTLKKIKECHIPSLHKLDPVLSPELEKIVNKALAKDKNTRYNSAAELHRDLNSYLNRQFPDFSPHDLSLTLKLLYAEELLESRRKLIEYAKLSVTPNEDEKTAIALGIEKKEDNLDTVTDTESISSEEQRKRLDNLAPLQGRVLKTDIQASSARKKAEPTSSAQPSKNNKTPRQKQKPLVVQAPSDRSSMASVVALCSVLVLGGLFLYKPQKVSGLVCQIHSFDFCHSTVTVAQNNESSNINPDQITLASTSYNTVIMTRPPGAKIYIDNEEKGSTPAEVSLPQNKQVVLKLKKDGYKDLQRSLLAQKPGQTYNFDLLKSKVGYISIRVVPGTADLYINNKKVGSSHLDKYAVPADEALKIRAFDSFTNTSDEKILMLKENAHQSITMFLKRKSGQNK